METPAIGCEEIDAVTLTYLFAVRSVQSDSAYDSHAIPLSHPLTITHPLLGFPGMLADPELNVLLVNNRVMILGEERGEEERDHACAMKRMLLTAQTFSLE